MTTSSTPPATQPTLRVGESRGRGCTGRELARVAGGGRGQGKRVLGGGCRGAHGGLLGLVVVRAVRPPSGGVAGLLRGTLAAPWQGKGRPPGSAARWPATSESGDFSPHATRAALPTVDTMEIWVLGTLEVSHDGRAVDVRGPLPRRLLALLALTPGAGGQHRPPDRRVVGRGTAGRRRSDPAVARRAPAPRPVGSRRRPTREARLRPRRRAGCRRRARPRTAGGARQHGARRGPSRRGQRRARPKR